MSETFDRSQLDGKDREQLSEIASALGVKAVSRMRKADLVEAIVTAATGSNGAERPSPRKIRSTQVSDGDALASIAEEENALAGSQGSVDRSHQGQQQWRDDDGSANKRRRRRRGRDRERGPADGRPDRDGRPERA